MYHFQKQNFQQVNTYKNHVWTDLEIPNLHPVGSDIITCMHKYMHNELIVRLAVHNYEITILATMVVGLVLGLVDLLRTFAV